MQFCLLRRTTIYKYSERLDECPLQKLSKILDDALLQKACAPFVLAYGIFDNFLSLIESIYYGLIFLYRPWLAWAW